MKWTQLLFTLLLLIASCTHEDTNLRETFSHSERIIDQYPDSVVVLLENIKIPMQLSAADYAPNCGSKPDTENSRGYSMTVNGNKIVLTTYLTHIKYDMLGMPVDKWLPVAPENLIWNYEIYIPQWN